MDMNLSRMYETLKAQFTCMDGAAIAFSGGVDSTLLLWAARDALGDAVIAVTAKAAVVPDREYDEAVDFCAREGIRHYTYEFDVRDVYGLCDNSGQRCYFCKSHILKGLWKIARDNGISVLADGTNADDGRDFRPGAKAVAEQGVISPLKEAGLSKNDIRALSKSLGLPTWDKQSFACLASRVPYGERITLDILNAVGLAEQYLLDMGLKQLRVRYHRDLARIETDEAGFALLCERRARENVYARFKEICFKYTAVDLLGYRTGSMNDGMQDAVIEGAK